MTCCGLKYAYWSIRICYDHGGFPGETASEEKAVVKITFYVYPLRTQYNPRLMDYGKSANVRYMRV